MTRSLMAIAMVLALSACATQPTPIGAQCPRNCEKAQCIGGDACTCGCHDEHMKGKDCPHHKK